MSLTVALYILSLVFPNKEPLDNNTQSAMIIPSFNSVNNSEIKPDSLIKQYLQKITHVVKSGETFYGILSQFDISHQISNQIYQSLKPLGFSALFPGDSLVVLKKSDSVIDSVSLLSKKKHWYSVSLVDTLIKADKRTLKVSNYINLINGTLETSLSEAMQKNGVSDLITGKFVDIFAWDINFFLDPRKGDRFQILFEQKYAEGLYGGYGEILAARYYSGNKLYSAFGLKDSTGIIHYYDDNGKSVQKQFLKAPLKYTRISSGFTYKRKHPILGIVRPHLGIDYAAPAGTPVLAAADGKIQFAGRKGDYGNLVIISHGGAYQTYYGHLLSFSSKIRTGTYVVQGSIIGLVGATGLATGPHLDYRMQRENTFVNPSTVNLPSAQQVDASQETLFSEFKQYCLNGFDYRFSMNDGLYILEINTPIIKESSTQIINIRREN